ncbi:DUF433 domain-containing protein [Runella sp.]|jgi:uncharacterized protein (DUF433 family)|uniref:DUF433 domain-containing protein n=1 Tax=Runella sp. TaxID=1960881 RepID=UPI0026121072|nr:DUF433 domain-containing protein [Runella sp.]
MNWQDHIHADPLILNGKPVIKGTRLSVEFILERLSDGWTEQMILENYPRLTHESLLAVYTFMLQMAKDGLLYLPTYPLKQAS